MSVQVHWFSVQTQLLGSTQFAIDHRKKKLITYGHSHICLASVLCSSRKDAYASYLTTHIYLYIFIYLFLFLLGVSAKSFVHNGIYNFASLVANFTYSDLIIIIATYPLELYTALLSLGPNK